MNNKKAILTLTLALLLLNQTYAITTNTEPQLRVISETTEHAIRTGATKETQTTVKALTEYTEASIKQGYGTPFNPTYVEHTLVKLYENPNRVTRVGNVTIDSTAVLKQGIKEEWGYKHIFEYIRPGETTTRAQQVLQQFPDFRDSEGILNAVGDVLKADSKDGTVIKKPFINYEGRMRYLEVRVADTAPGSINTITIGGYVP